MLEIEILYTCGQCELEPDIRLKVPARRASEDIKEWVRKMSIHIQSDHLKRSPDCQAEALANIKIPINDNEYNGIGILNTN